jgi:two-component system response regulator FixJ
MDRLSLHILDSDSPRRAQLARLAIGAGNHAEIYSSIAELIAHAPPNGLVLAHDDQSGETVAQLITSMQQAGQWLPVIAYADEPITVAVVEAVKAGALDYLTVPKHVEQLNKSIGIAYREGEKQRNQRTRSVEAHQRISQLTVREREVLDHLAEGCSNKAIARYLDISPRTVEIHRMKMMGKLGAHHAADAVRLRIDASRMETA